MPLLSVVIPTRNRLEYLRDALKSALDQACPEIEVIVADNATDDGTREYLASLGDAIKVTRSEEPLSMTDNWYRALELVTGEWITVIGDDDCLMRDYVGSAKRAIASSPETELFRWDCPIYRWPDSRNESERNHLQFALSSHHQRVDSATTLRNMFERIHNVMSPPGLYHCLSRTSLIKKVRDKYGELRLGIVPDFGSGILFLSVTDHYVVLKHPLTVMGFGRKSTGMSFKNGDDDKATSRAEFYKLSRLADLKATYPIFDVEDVNVYQWRLLLSWRDYLGNHGLKFEFNHDKMFLYCVSRLNRTPENERAEVARKMIEFGVSRGMARDHIEGRVNTALSQQHLLRPHHLIEKNGELSTLRLGCDLTHTSIRTATDAAGLIHGFLTR